VTLKGGGADGYRRNLSNEERKRNIIVVHNHLVTLVKLHNLRGYLIYRFSTSVCFSSPAYCTSSSAMVSIGIYISKGTWYESRVSRAELLLGGGKGTGLSEKVFRASWLGFRDP
jgi:hypothetical protein